MPESQVQERVKELMTQFDLHKYASFKVDALSGGWKRRVLIARALMHNPKIVILDEPTVGLDPDVRRSLWKYIQKLKSQGITVIITTHYLDEAEVLSDRICILDKGKTLLVTTVAALKEKHQKNNLEEAFLQLVEDQEHLALDQQQLHQ
jgi:ABC-2 type transport system ATP-binding protein